LSFFDIGLGNGLRNKLSESNAKKKFEEGRMYISSTYFVLSIIALFVFVIFYFINQSINYRELLNIRDISNETLQMLFLIVVVSFCIHLVFKTLNAILTALHKAALSSFITFLGQVGVLCGVVYLRNFHFPNLT